MVIVSHLIALCLVSSDSIAPFLTSFNSADSYANSAPKDFSKLSIVY